MICPRCGKSALLRNASRRNSFFYICDYCYYDELSIDGFFIEPTKNELIFREKVLNRNLVEKGG